MAQADAAGEALAVTGTDVVPESPRLTRRSLTVTVTGTETEVRKVPVHSRVTTKQAGRAGSGRSRLRARPESRRPSEPPESHRRGRVEQPAPPGWGHDS